ncbi:MAG: thioredoxin domain-containing protein, partial [Rikenellaceae bacterium]|nr:thioredoxin domain-containing protein [Rikenellaceae bacterium]
MMKLRIVLLLFLAAYISSGKAQNRSIPFEETKLWTEIVEKARTAEKIIFVDCYTDWCGPCKMLSANVFTRDSVADFFQEHFVNTKFEMEKDADGIAYRQTWEVKAYPTLLFIDPRTEQVIHRVVGAVKPEALIQAAQKALDPTLNLRAMEERYEQGDRSPDFMVSYLGALQSAGLHPRKISIALEYLESLSAERFATGYTWQILRNHIEDPLCGPMLRLWNERFHFYELPEVPREEVE